MVHNHQILNSLKIHEHKIHFFDTSLVKNNSKPTLESEICITPDKYIFLPITNLKNLQSNKYQHLFKKLLEFNSDNKIVLTIDTSHLSHKKYWNLKSILTEYQLLDKVEFIPMTTVNFQFLITRSILTVLDLENLSENEYHFLKFTCIQNSSKYFEFNKANIDSHSIHKLFDHIITSNKTDNYDEISKFNYIDQITNKFLKIYSQASG